MRDKEGTGARVLSIPRVGVVPAAATMQQVTAGEEEYRHPAPSRVSGLIRNNSVLSECDGRGGGLQAIGRSVDFRGGAFKAIIATLADAVVQVVLSETPASSDPTSPTRLSLLESCELGDVETVRLLLASGAPVDQSDPEGWSALFFACDNGHLDSCRVLLENGAQVNRVTPTGTTALMIAAAGGYASIVEVLLEHRANARLQSRSGGFTALMEACSGGHYDAATVLLEHDASTVELVGQHGETALMCACMCGSLRMVQLLCSYGASRSVRDRKGHTVWSLAVDLSQQQTVPPLDGSRTACHRRIAEWLVETEDWVTPLHHLECLSGERAAALISAGADLHARRAPGAPSPLDLARGVTGRATDPEGMFRPDEPSPAAAAVLDAWSRRLVALAMGTHSRLGEHSPVRRLAGLPEVLQLIVRSARGESLAASLH